MDRDAVLVHAAFAEHRIRRILERKDIPPMVRLRAQSTKVGIEKLIQAIHDGR